MNQPNQSIPPKIPQARDTSKWVTILIIVIVALIFIDLAAWGAYKYFYSVSDSDLIACTLEAKICPDGSSVGRVAPDCKFAECPEVIDPTVDWQIYQNAVDCRKIDTSDWVEFRKNDSILEFEYPDNLTVSTDNNNELIAELVEIYPEDYEHGVLLPKMSIDIIIHQQESVEFSPFYHPYSDSIEKSTVIDNREGKVYFSEKYNGGERNQYYINLENNYLLEMEQFVDSDYLDTYKSMTDCIIKTLKIKLVFYESEISNN